MDKAMMKSFSQQDMNDLIKWLEIIVKAPEDEFIERFLELKDIVPMAILDRAKKQLNVVIQHRFDKLTDFAFSKSIEKKNDSNRTGISFIKFPFKVCDFDFGESH